MKKTLTIILAIQMVFGLKLHAQNLLLEAPAGLQHKNDKSVKKAKHPQILRGSEMFCEDFANGFDGNNPFGAWTIEDNGQGATGNVITSGQTSLFNGEDFASTSHSNGYATMDVIGYTLDNDLLVDNVAPGITAYLTSPEINMTDLTSAVVTWESYFYYCCASASPLTLEVSVDNGDNWELFAAEGDFSPAANAYSENGQVISVDISAIAAGQSSVRIRFAYNSALSDNFETNGDAYFAYFWAIDDVCITEKPTNDVQLSYSVISHIPETGMEYGSIPINQLNGTHFFNANVLNFGVADQNNVTLSASFTNGGTTIDLNQNLGTIATNTYADFEMSTTDPLTVGIYNGTFTLVSDEETEGENFTNNTDSRSFAITDNLYALDGIGVYPETNLTTIGPGMFLEDGENISTGALMTMYYLEEPTELYGIHVLIPNQNDMIGNTVYAFLADTTDVLNNNAENHIVQSDYYVITQEDVNNGYLDLFYEEILEMDANAYFAGIYIEDGVEFRVIDDLTVPQPGVASMIYISSVVYGNGNALAIQLYTQETVGITDYTSTGFSVEQNSPNPAKKSTSIHYTLDHPSEVSLEINDLTGRLIKTIAVGQKNRGYHEILVDLENFNSGVYSYTLIVGDSRITKQLIKE